MKLFDGCQIIKSVDQPIVSAERITPFFKEYSPLLVLLFGSVQASGLWLRLQLELL